MREGLKVKILVDNPYAAALVAGDICTIESVINDSVYARSDDPDNIPSWYIGTGEDLGVLWEPWSNSQEVSVNDAPEPQLATSGGLELVSAERPVDEFDHPSNRGLCGQEDNNPKARMGALKCPTQFVPPVAKLYLGLAMEEGANKYGPFNWRQEPISASTYMGAMDRHLAAWFDGEDNAPDSGIHHLAHVMASCALILDSMECGTLIDDRNTDGPAAAFLARILEERRGT